MHNFYKGISTEEVARKLYEEYGAELIQKEYMVDPELIGIWFDYEVDERKELFLEDHLELMRGRFTDELAERISPTGNIGYGKKILTYFIRFALEDGLINENELRETRKYRKSIAQMNNKYAKYTSIVNTWLLNRSEDPRYFHTRGHAKDKLDWERLAHNFHLTFPNAPMRSAGELKSQVYNLRQQRKKEKSK